MKCYTYVDGRITRSIRSQDMDIFKNTQFSLDFLFCSCFVTNKTDDSVSLVGGELAKKFELDQCQLSISYIRQY